MFKVFKLNIYVSMQTVLSQNEKVIFNFFFSILDIEIFEITVR